MWRHLAATGGIRESTQDANKIEQTLKYRKAPFPKSVATTFVAHCRYCPDETELSQKIHIFTFCLKHFLSVIILKKDHGTMNAYTCFIKAIFLFIFYCLKQYIIT